MIEEVFALDPRLVVLKADLKLAALAAQLLVLLAVERSAGAAAWLRRLVVLVLIVGLVRPVAELALLVELILEPVQEWQELELQLLEGLAWPLVLADFLA